MHGDVRGARAPRSCKDLRAGSTYWFRPEVSGARGRHRLCQRPAGLGAAGWFSRTPAPST